MTDTTPTPDTVFNSNSINASILRQLIARINSELASPEWVHHMRGYLVSCPGITNVTSEILFALSRHYRKYGWEFRPEADKFVFRPI